MDDPADQTSATTVDDFYNKISQLLQITDKEKEPSLHIWASDSFTRTLVLVTANYFENEITETLKQFFDSQSPNKLVKAFTLKASERKYYTYFDWGKPNANNFFSLFGDEFKNKACNDVNESPALKDAMFPSWK